MSVEVRPLGVKCNIRCTYCYQNPQREALVDRHRYDLNAIKNAVQKTGGPFTLFGGEPLLVPIEDLENLWSWGLERYGRNAIQTNGSLINDRHIELFKRCRVSVGISVDGPGELNDLRSAGTLENTRRATERTHAAIARLCAEGVTPSLIATLHRRNATAERIPVFLDWLERLDSLGIRSVGLHLLEIDNETVRQHTLSLEENISALSKILELEPRLRNLRFPLFNAMRRLLQGDDAKASCVWKSCDPYTTRAVQGIEGHGERSNCGRTNKDGIDFVKGSLPGFERYLMLYQTPQDVGGCRGCRFFSMCKGQCPGTAIDGDWRNRTEYCEVWKALFIRFENELLKKKKWVLSRSRHRRVVEEGLLNEWKLGRSGSLTKLVSSVRDAEPKALV